LAVDSIRLLVMSDRLVLSDAAWEWLEPLLPSSRGRRGGRWRDHRQVIEAIAWKYRTGSPWRELPERFGPWQTAYERLDRWSRDGTWAWLLAAAQARADAAGELDWLVAADSSLVRVHQHGGHRTPGRWQRRDRRCGRRRGHGGRGGMTTIAARIPLVQSRPTMR